MLACEFHPLVDAELDEAVAHYEAVQPGKGLEFASRVQAAIEHIRAFPEFAPITLAPVHPVLAQPSTRCF